tara:strand:+ start:4835 stop:4993 length:159 start_codon:yes stop_codon:yes gene_type:complete
LSILLSQPNWVIQGLNPYESYLRNIVAMNYPLGLFVELFWVKGQHMAASFNY